MNNIAELFVCYQGTNKLIVYEIGTSLEEFLQQIQKNFSLNAPIKFLYNNVEITSTHSLIHDKKLSVVVTEENQISKEPQLSSDSVVSNEEQQEISLKDVEKIKFSADVLSEKLNEWAISLKFKLIKPEGTKKLLNGYSQSLVYSEKGCKFRLTFKSNKEGKIYELNNVLAKKNCIHSKESFF